jgi:hypothetical protein
MKNKKGSFFPYLIVIAMLILYSFAFIKIGVVEKNKYVSDVKKFVEVLDIKYRVDEKTLKNYFDSAYELSFNTALKKFINNIDNSPTCKIKNIANVKYFSNNCVIDRDLFKSIFLEEFEKYIKNYLTIIKEEYGIDTQHSCKLEKSLVCDFMFEKIFVFSTNNITIKKRFSYDKEINFEILEELEKIKSKKEQAKEKEGDLVLSERIGKFLYYNESEKKLKYEDFYFNIYFENR